MANATITVRLDGKVKQRAEKALAKRGLSVSDAVRMLLAIVAEDEGLPFHVHASDPAQRRGSSNEVPNETTVAAIRELESGGGKRFTSLAALFKDLGM